jgi:hypothetical protein
MAKMQWSTDPELNAALELDAKKLADMGVEGYGDEEPTCTKCGCFFTVDVGDEATPYCHDCAHTLVEDFEAREPLVQEVIAAHKAACAVMDDPKLTARDFQRYAQALGLALKAALDKLAGWEQ